MSKKKKLVVTVLTLILVVSLGVGLYFANYWNLLPKKVYTGEYFGITRVVSDIDYNENGIDDYMDIVLGARTYVDTKPSYDGTYYKGGYPPEEIGVCTDVIWNGLKGAGYCLKDMIDKDIEENVDAYWRVKEKPDKNIDFRRVPNIKVFLERNAYIIHNGGQPVFEEDALTRQEISGHYRFELSETCSVAPWNENH